MTNALESLHSFWARKEYQSSDLYEILDAHLSIVDDLKFSPMRRRILYENFTSSCDKLDMQLLTISPGNKELVDRNYDLVVSHGEIFSSMILRNLCMEKGQSNGFTRASNFIVTDSIHKNANVRMAETKKRLADNPVDFFQNYQVVFTQGFLGGYYRPNSRSINTTTLGREGSDFTAAILARCFHAHSNVTYRTKDITLFKDVLGIYSADPKRDPNAILFENLSYDDALRLEEIPGAKVVHRKALILLQDCKIPLRVRSIDNLEHPGTLIS